MIVASDLSGLSCRPFCMYHCLASADAQPGRCVVGVHCKAKLHVVSILVVNTVACNDVSNWTGIDGEQDGFQY